MRAPGRRDFLGNARGSFLEQVHFPGISAGRGEHISSGGRIIMFNSPVLEVAIGLVFCYASVALMVSSVTEAISSALRLRA